MPFCLGLMNDKHTLSAYSDESGTFDHRFQSIAVISSKEAVLQQLRNKLQSIIDENGIKEVHFSEIGGYKSATAKAARAFIDYSVRDYSRYSRVRVDVIV